MEITIYHNPRCSKSRATLELIRARGIEPEIIEYLQAPPTRAQLESIIELLGVPASAIVRTTVCPPGPRPTSMRVPSGWNGSGMNAWNPPVRTSW